MKVKLSAQLSVSYPVSSLGSLGCASSTLGCSSCCLFLYRRTVIAGVLAAAAALLEQGLSSSQIVAQIRGSCMAGPSPNDFLW